LIASFYANQTKGQ